VTSKTGTGIQTTLHTVSHPFNLFLSHRNQTITEDEKEVEGKVYEDERLIELANGATHFNILLLVSAAFQDLALLQPVTKDFIP